MNIYIVVERYELGWLGVFADEAEAVAYAAKDDHYEVVTEWVDSGTPEQIAPEAAGCIVYNPHDCKPPAQWGDEALKDIEIGAIWRCGCGTEWEFSDDHYLCGGWSTEDRRTFRTRHIPIAPRPYVPQPIEPTLIEPPKRRRWWQW